MTNQSESYYTDRNNKFLDVFNMPSFIHKNLWCHESVSICCKDGWIIKNSKSKSNLFNKIEELVKNKTTFNIYFHKYNEDDLNKSIDYYYEFRFDGWVTVTKNNEVPYPFELSDK